MLPITEYPSIVKDREMYLRPAFAFRNQIDNCMRYLTGLIVLPERKNVSSISRSFVDSKDQASVNNFITDSTWSEELFHDAAIRMVKDEVEKQKVNHGIVVIDDTLSEKTGKHIEGVGVFWDHVQRKYTLAHNIVSTHYITRTFHVPLDFAIYKKREDCKNDAEFKTKVEIAKELMSKASSYGIPISSVVFDSWYAEKSLFEHIRQLGIEGWVTQAKSNRVITSDDSITEMNLSEFVKTISKKKDRFKPLEIYTSLAGEKKTYYAFTTSVRMKSLDGRKFRLVISYDNQQLEGDPSFFVSNVRIWESKKILQIYAMRWSIEGFHRDAKQSLGLEDYQLRKIQGVRRHIAMVFFAYILLQLGSGFDIIMDNLKGNLRTIGSRCRLAGTQILHSLISFVMKMARKNMDARKIYGILTKPLTHSNTCWL
jgi:DDE superfamily endonuclease